MKGLRCTTPLHLAALAGALGTAGCFAEMSDESGDTIDESFAIGGKADSALGPAQTSAVLGLANTADEESLDEDVGLDSRAARNMVAHRNGPDGQLGSADDDLFDSLTELDAIKWVGPSALGKLLEYALDNAPAGAAEDCLIISEYIEGAGQYNKAIEIFNCGSQAADLASYSVCMVRNGDTSCTVTADLGDATLEAGAVTTVCRRQSFHPASMDPIPTMAQACELERAAVMTFSGDDRLLLLRADGSTADSLGRVGYRPPESTWSNLLLDRCNFSPADGLSYYEHLDYFHVRSAYSISGYGQPPTADCSP